MQLRPSPVLCFYGWPGYCEPTQSILLSVNLHFSAPNNAPLRMHAKRFLPSRRSCLRVRFPPLCLIRVMADIAVVVPAKRYALTLKLMLKRSKQRRQASLSRSPSTVDAHRMQAVRSDSTGSVVMQHHGPHSSSSQEPFSPTYHAFPSPEGFVHTQIPQPGAHPHHMPPYVSADAANLDQIWRGFEQAPSDQLPMWLNDQTLGGAQFTQQGMNAFLLPQDFLPPQPQIW